MIKGSIITRIIIWGIVTVFLIGLLVAGLARGGFGFSFPPTIHVGGVAQKVHEETLPLAGIDSVSIGFNSADIRFLPGDGDSLRVVQYAGANFPEDQYFRSSVSGSALTVKQPTFSGWNTWWGGSLGEQYAEVYLPASYAGALSVGCSSGDVSLPDSLQQSSLTVSLSSGNLTGGDIRAGRMDIQSSSGDVRLKILAADRFTLSSASGEIWIDSVSGAGKLSAASGDIRIGALTGSADISAASGSIEISGFSGEGSVYTASGSVRAELLALTGDVQLKSTSGEVYASLPKDAAVSVHADSTSGSVQSDFPLTFGASRHNASGDTNAGAQHALTLSTTSGSIRLSAK